MRSDRTRADWRLIVFHAGAATVRRPGRSVLVAVGVALGIAIFVVTVGWSQTVGSQINATFDRLAATELRLRDTQADRATDAALPDDFERRIAVIDGVVAGGRLWEAGTPDVRTSDVAESVSMPMLTADPGFLDAAGAQVGSGRLYDGSLVELGQPVVVLGPGAAARLGIAAVHPGLSVQVGTTRVLVIGVLSEVGSAPELDGALVVPPTAPVGPGGSPPPADRMSALVRVELGAARQVAAQLPTAARPHGPERLGVIVPPEPTTLRGDVQTSLDALAYGAATLSLLIGAIGIMNSMLMAVAQRSSEIGLRRALGARPQHVVVQFLLEGAVLGALGAVIGVLLGEAGLIGIALANDWTAVLDRRLLASAPVAGIAIGVLASSYPALRAARVRPATSLRT